MPATPAPVPAFPTPPESKGPGGPSARTLAYWEQFLKDHDIPPIGLYVYVEKFRERSKFKDVEAAIRGYLKLRPRDAQPWMYEALTVAIEFNGASPDRIKEALGYAAIVAERDGNPNFILNVADMLYLRGLKSPDLFDYTLPVGGKPRRIAVGALLDEVAEKVPHRPQPILMSMNLARRTLDPTRMADALERAASIGWPGMDDVMRSEARRQVEELAEVLKEENRENEADALLARLPTALGRDLFVRLTWDGDADLDLVVDEPLGVSASHFNPRTVSGGALVKEGKGKAREEVYACPRAFDGDYAIRVEAAYEDPEKPPITSAKLEIITREGLPGERIEVRRVDLPAPATILVRGKDGKTEALPSPNLPRSAPVVVRLDGGRRKTALPYIAPATQPSSILLAPVADRKGPARPSAPASPGVSSDPGRISARGPSGARPDARAAVRP